MKKLIFIILFLYFSTQVRAQQVTVLGGANLPGTCNVGNVFISTLTPGIYLCTATNTYTALTYQVPSGTLLAIITGTCPAGFSEATSLNGKFLRGTIAANGDVGTSAGSDTITPTISSLSAAAQIFTGSILATHTHTVTAAGTNGTVSITPLGTNAAITAGTPAGTISALTTGADSSTTGGVAKAIAQTPTFTGSILATHTHTFTGSSTTVGAETFTGSSVTSGATSGGTPAGTNTSSSVTGTLNSFDNRPAYTNVIFCSKN